LIFILLKAGGKMRKRLFLIFVLLFIFSVLFSIPSIITLSDYLIIPQVLSLDTKLNHLYAGYSNGMFAVWNIANGNLEESKRNPDTQSPIVSIEYSPNGLLLSCGHKDGIVQIWAKESLKLFGEFIREGNAVWAQEYSADSKFLFTGNADGKLRKWSIDTKNLEAVYTRHRRLISSAAFSSNPKILATGSSDSTIFLWDVESGEIINEMSEHTGWITSVDFSPNGKFLISTGADKIVKLWAIPRGYLLRNLGPFLSEVWAGKFISENLIVIGEASGDLSLWNIETAREIRKVAQAHEAGIRSIDFSPLSNQIFTSSNDGTIKVWDSASLNLIATLILSGNGEWISYMPTGKFVSSINALVRNVFQIKDGNKYFSFEDYLDFLLKVDNLPLGDISAPHINPESLIMTPIEHT